MVDELLLALFMCVYRALNAGFDSFTIPRDSQAVPSQDIPKKFEALWVVYGVM
jgi:hypothetical protein